MMRVDAHHHVWDLGVRNQDWMTGARFDPIRRTFQLPELEEQARAAGIDRTVLVQTVAHPAETGEFLELAATEPFVAGVVGWIDLDSPRALTDLDHHLDHPAAKALVGIRDLAEYKPDPYWYSQEDIIESLRGIGRRQLTYDLLVLPHQLDAATLAVQACPDQLFVLDHLGKPPIARAELDAWARAIIAIARHPNVACKLSGLVTEADWTQWTVADLRPAVEVALDAFGPDRLMFGSDWPVCLLAASYAEVIATADELVADLTLDEREQIWSGTAVRYYRLQGLTGPQHQHQQ